MTGALTVATYPQDPVRLACRVCGRAGQYTRATLISSFGPDAVMPEVLRQLSGPCARWGDASDPCGAHYPDLRATITTKGPPSPRG
jgi:hypothetical protein